ncbi:MAG TPA: zinc dependent phospholipase C family protein [Bacillota bacterium]|nr:zinc dependent phospholipase C family protein [Bacillota bacterium]
MPDCVTHYQFGQDVFERLDEDLKSCVLAYKREYDTGLQGPDIFFFYKPYRRNDTVKYGHGWHEKPGVRMFGPLSEAAREGAALSYLTGLVCHYALDSSCHPYVYEHSLGPYDHTLMEAAYDRHIMLRHGLAKARTEYLHTGQMDFDSMASLWPGMSAERIRHCVKDQRFYKRFLDDRRNFLLFLDSVAGKRGMFSSMSLPDEISEEQQEHGRHLDELYLKALQECPRLISQVCGAGEAQNRMQNFEGGQLQGFDRNYKGEYCDGT